jgi:hypothetical protein
MKGSDRLVDAEDGGVSRVRSRACGSLEGAKARTKKESMIAALKALRHPKASEHPKASPLADKRILQ